ncbi:MAG: methyl-accepting chemotaxis protein [Deltaproteobacteria bacterium]|nr:methyl-accepting chemotaxis protein [Deltaproteobacteria bacterium]MBW1941603.1 methyl-accepting chemotaxis protein [Deltaproteobacteria bacterium]
MVEKFKRKKFPLSGRPRHLRLLAIVLSYNLLIIVFMAFSLFAPDVIALWDQSASFREQAEAADRMLTLHARIWPVMIALLCLIGLHSLRAFHRFLGPLHRFQESFNRVSNGDLSVRIKLRKGDLLGREQETFNAMLDILEEKMKTSQLACHEALQSLNALERTVADAGHGDQKTRERLQAQRKNLETLCENVGFFQAQEDQEPQ